MRLNIRQLRIAVLAAAEPFQVDHAAVAVIPVGTTTSVPISVDAT